MTARAAPAVRPAGAVRTADCLHRMVEAQAARTPDAPAVVFEGGGLTYGDLNRRANRLAHLLRAGGVGPDAVVGVGADSGPEMIVALLAVLKAGGAYLPLDPTNPPERLAFLLADARPVLVLAQPHLRGLLPAGARVIPLGAGLEDGERAEDLTGGAGPDDLAYVIYTSGSTGQPKGVLLAHRGACNNLRWRQERFPLTADDRMLQSYSFSFDPSVWAIFWPLASGATLVLMRPGGTVDADYVVRTLAAHRITVAGFGPAQLRVLLAHTDIGQCQALRHLFCGGEAMPPDLPRLVHTRLGADLHNVYGPTEATIDAACWTVPRGEGVPLPRSVPIGHPIAGTELFLLDDRLRPVSGGEAGEIYIAGVGLARGYLRRPELTAERFLPHPFDQTPGARLYRTGDLARRGGGGELYYLGRTDTQVKMRGYRIELGEIEAALLGHPDVLDAAAVLREDRPGEKRLAAYVVPRAGASPTGTALREFLARTLPAHMVPAAVVFQRALPLTSSGKRDRAALPPPGGETRERGPDFVAPRNPLEQQLAQVWEDLLDIRPVGIRDDFLELGGHSLLAARLLDRIAQTCGRSVPVSALYEGGTVESLAALLLRDEAPAPMAPPTLLTGGGRRPFFYLHGYYPLGGFYAHHLARRLHADQPMLLLHAPTERGRGPLTIESMAAAYVAVVRTAQPHGPYRLGGFCGSGLIAYEMARLLAASGEAVEFLALIEVHAINPRLRLALRRLSGSPSRFLAWQRLLLPPWAWAQSWGRRVKGRGGAGLIEACDRAAAAYVPLPYAGPVHLLRAADDPETFPGDPFALWREVAPALTACDVPGTHVTCLLEDVNALGERLGACLDVLDTD